MMSRTIEVAKIVSTELQIHLVIICPYCDQSNTVEEFFSFSGGPQDLGPQDLRGDLERLEIDSIKCWNCHKISFLDEECQNAYRLNEDEPITDSESVKSVDGKPA